MEPGCIPHPPFRPAPFPAGIGAVMKGLPCISAQSCAMLRRSFHRSETAAPWSATRFSLRAESRVAQGIPPRTNRPSVRMSSSMDNLRDSALRRCSRDLFSVTPRLCTRP